MDSAQMNAQASIDQYYSQEAVNGAPEFDARLLPSTTKLLVLGYKAVQASIIASPAYIPGYRVFAQIIALSRERSVLLDGELSNLFNVVNNQLEKVSINVVTGRNELTHDQPKTDDFGLLEAISALLLNLSTSKAPISGLRVVLQQALRTVCVSVTRSAPNANRYSSSLRHSDSFPHPM